MTDHLAAAHAASMAAHHHAGWQIPFAIGCVALLVAVRGARTGRGGVFPVLVFVAGAVVVFGWLLANGGPSWLIP